MPALDGNYCNNILVSDVISIIASMGSGGGGVGGGED